VTARSTKRGEKRLINSANGGYYNLETEQVGISSLSFPGTTLLSSGD
jgi:hypothetical protein